MIEKISNYIVNNYLYKDEDLKEDEKEIAIYGVKRIVEDIPKNIAFLLIFYFTNNLKELAIVLITTILYKTFVGGAHARTNIGCFVGTLIIISMPVIMAKLNISENYIITMLILNFIYSIYVLYKIAPADTEEVPIINKEKRKKFKIIAFISLILIYGFIIFNFNNLYIIEIIGYTVLFINLGTSKLMYKILRCTKGSDSEEYKELYK